MAAFLAAVAAAAQTAAPPDVHAPDVHANSPDWVNYVRIGAYGLERHDAATIVSNATRDDVFGIEVDNDIEGRYESFINPEEKLKAVRAVAEKAHQAGNRAFVYVAGTECITANADKTPHTLAKEHPDWLQRDINGKPAIFGSGSAFWIAPGDEDVWVTPYAPEWRKIYMQHIREIAATGIDGIYVDIPYWMTHFDGWENTWASFDDYTVAAFKQQTGLDAKKDFKLGDFSDPNFRKWVDFRMDTFTKFMQEIDQNAKSVNPQIKTIPEIYPGVEEEAVRVGADVYSLYPVVDAITHEYEFGEGDHMASSRTPFDWFAYRAGMESFRAFAEGKPTWMLNYSWDGDEKVDKKESMENLAMSHVMAGANFWDAPGHSMAGSNDEATRQKIFTWIHAHENEIYSPRLPMHPVGVYFSPRTRNYYAKDFIASYRGILILLLQKHLEFQVVTPRTLASPSMGASSLSRAGRQGGAFDSKSKGFSGPTLILPDVRILSDEEKSQLKAYVANGGKLIITGNDATQFGANPNIVRFPDAPGKTYSKMLEADFLKADPDSQKDFLAVLGMNPISVEASSLVATSIASVNGMPHVFLANFAGLQGHVNPVQTPQNVRIVVPQEMAGKAYFLPFLGDVQPVVGATLAGGTAYALPPITKGAIFWIEPATAGAASKSSSRSGGHK